MLTSENSIAGRLAFAFMCFFAAGLAFSISVAQTGLGIAFLIFIATIATRNGRASLNLQGAGRLKMLYVILLLWVAWRLVHIAISPLPVRELIEAREVWLMLIPLFIYIYASTRRRLFFLASCFVAGIAISSAHTAWNMRADFLNWVRGHGSGEMHHLNFAGMAALASVLGMGLSLAWYFSGKKFRAIIAATLTLMAFIGLWLTKSRGSIAAVAIILAIYVYVQLYSKIQRWLYIAVLGILLAVFIPRLPQSVVEQYRFPAAEVHAGSQAERRDLWQTGLAMIKEKTVIGWGERGYSLAYPQFMVAGAVGVAAYDFESKEASHMHNDFINTWVLYGLVGLILQLVYYFLGLVFYIRERFRIRLESDRALAAAAAATLPLMAVMGLTQCHFTSELVQMSFWLCVGVLFSILDTDRAGTAS
jgi:O-antigen ligase